MSIEPGGEIGEEVHEDRDQFFRIEKGKGEVLIDGSLSKIKSDDAVIVPAGARHNIVNTGDKPLRLYTLYAPSEHRDGTVHESRSRGLGAAFRRQDNRISEGNFGLLTMLGCIRYRSRCGKAKLNGRLA